MDSEEAIGKTDKQTHTKARLTHHKLGPDEMQLRSANAIGDPAAGENKAEFIC